MTALADELRAVLGLAGKATAGEWRCNPDGDVEVVGGSAIAECWRREDIALHYNNAELISSAVNFLRAHAVELGDALRERDALRAQVERDDLIYTDDLVNAAACDVGLFEIVSDEVPWTQTIARLRGFLARVTILARRESKSDRAALGAASGGGKG